MLTAKGVKPICRFQQVFESTYLSGAFSPLDGTDFQLILPKCDAAHFQLFLDEFSKEKPNEFKIMVLDNGRFHHAKCLNIPKNIQLIFLPPYSPELNPAEKIWANYKRTFSNKLHKTIEEVEDFLCDVVSNTSKKMIQSITAFDYIFEDQFWTKI